MPMLDNFKVTVTEADEKVKLTLDMDGGHSKTINIPSDQLSKMVQDMSKIRDQLLSSHK